MYNEVYSSVLDHQVGLMFQEEDMRLEKMQQQVEEGELLVEK